MFALNCTITSVLASKVTVKSCYVFYWSDPSVSSGNKKKKRNSLKLLLLLFFKNKKCLKKQKKKTKQKKTTNPNLGHFCNRLNPSLNKKPCNCQTNQSKNFVDAKEIFWQSSSTARNRKLVIMKNNWKLFSNQGLKTRSYHTAAALGSKLAPRDAAAPRPHPAVLVSDAFCSFHCELSFWNWDYFNWCFRVDHHLYQPSKVLIIDKIAAKISDDSPADPRHGKWWGLRVGCPALPKPNTHLAETDRAWEGIFLRWEKCDTSY